MSSDSSAGRPSAEHRRNDHVAGATAVRHPTRWRRFWTWLRDFEEAMDTTYDDIQDRRIAALEKEVGRLRALVIRES